MSLQLVEFIKNLYSTNDFIPLHAPQFNGNEKKYVLNTIESTFVSSVGKYVDDFEAAIENFTGARRAVATTNGTAALHTSLHLAGVKSGDLVITQALTFVATCNALQQMGAKPIFIDVSEKSLGLCPLSVSVYLEEFALIDNDGVCRHKDTFQVIRAVVPMHTFGHPVEIDELLLVCQKWNLILVEDAAESLGSFYKGRHTGTFGHYGAISFNGNKIITTGGGGIILCKDDEGGRKAKHVTTTAKVPHPYEFYHDEAGYNYRMPNINAALGCAQMEVLDNFIIKKRSLAAQYCEFFNSTAFEFVMEPDYAKSNYWLNSIICPNKHERDRILSLTNEKGVMTRPVWQLMHRLPMYSNSFKGDLSNSEYLEARLLNIPSSPPVLV